MLAYQKYRQDEPTGWTRIDLLLALYDKALERLDRAEQALRANDTATALPQLAKTQLIVTELAAGVRVEGGVDVTSQPAVDALAAKLTAEGVKLDVLVHVAGVLGLDELGAIDYDDVRRQFEINTLGPLRTIEALRKLLPDGAKVEKSIGKAAKVAVAADADPREFLIDVDSWPADKPIRLTVTYSACVAEAWIEFAAEVSVVVARGADGQAVCYPVGLNRHDRHILDSTMMPAPIGPAASQEARAIALSVAHALETVGVLCVEFFLTAAGGLLVNEIAPRPHNSGHLTIEAVPARSAVR